MPDRKVEIKTDIQEDFINLSAENYLTNAVNDGSINETQIEHLKGLLNTVKQSEANRSRCAIHGTDEDCDKAKKEYSNSLNELLDYIASI